jgi:hypothetical protein
VVVNKGLKRRLTVLLPFVLIGLGGLCLMASPWPEILKQSLHGAHINFVRLGWRTAGLPAVTVVSWAVAIWLSLRIGPRSEKA